MTLSRTELDPEYSLIGEDDASGIAWGYRGIRKRAPRMIIMRVLDPLEVEQSRLHPMDVLFKELHEIVLHKSMPGRSYSARVSFTLDVTEDSNK